MQGSVFIRADSWEHFWMQWKHVQQQFEIADKCSPFQVDVGNKVLVNAENEFEYQLSNLPEAMNGRNGRGHRFPVAQ